MSLNIIQFNFLSPFMHQNKIVNGNKHEVVVISDSESENELPTSNRYSALSNEEVFNPIGQVTDSDSYVTDDSFNFKPFTAQQSKSIDHEAVILINSDSDEQSFQDDIGPALHSPAVIDNVGECIEVISSGRQQKKIPRTIWADEPEQIVEEIPLDIDGLQVYRVIASERSEFSAKLKDGRHWKKDSRTEWAGFKSVRYRDCLGGYSCPNTDCFYFLEFKHPNRNRFKRKNICEYCEGIGDYTPCSARKYTAFRSDSEAYVYHIGLHTCYAKQQHNRPASIVQEAVQRDANVRPRQIQTMSILSDLRARKNWSEVESNARKVLNVKNLSNEKIKQKKVMEPHGGSFEAVRNLKTYTDTQDPLLIKTIDENNELVFKTSTLEMKIAKNMEASGEHFLSKEYCHFDGNHKRVKNYVTLTASVYHPMLRKQLVLASMNCKHEDETYVQLFWRNFNDAFKQVNLTEQKFNPKGWVTDMAGANFNGLSRIYGEDVMNKIKGCEFHFKQSIERKVKKLGDQGGETFKKLANELLLSATAEAYEAAIKKLKDFAKASAPDLKDWISWWDDRKENVFRAFTSFGAPQSNLAEVVHAGYKHRDRMGVNLLECAYFDIRDSILLALNLGELEKGGHECGYGQSISSRNKQQASRDIGHAERLGRDLMDFTVQQTGSSGKRKSCEPVEGCHPPKKRRNIGKLFDNRLETAKKLEDMMKVKKLTRLSSQKIECQILGTSSGRVHYTVTICNVPTCTCPDFKKQGLVVSCKHIIFVFLFIIRSEEMCNERHIGDDDLCNLLSNVEVDDKYKANPQRLPSSNRDRGEILRSHHLYNQGQTFTVHKKAKRTAKCSARQCQEILTVGKLALRVDGALSVIYERPEAVERKFYFCPKQNCVLQFPVWSNIRPPGNTSELKFEDGVTLEDISFYTDI
ncbi:uncharacterized protein [Clytia hemisphaerica]|uniref:uncharacterized protein n=1 Tax=Clytia hemisphaerica TaxID=252671 RepID=UPI0034D4250C